MTEHADDVLKMSDGTEWVKTPGVDEYTGWVPGEDGCWLLAGEEFRKGYGEEAAISVEEAEGLYWSDRKNTR